MKKLMTMIAAVATAFGLYATEEFKAGTCFNDWTGISDRTGDENLTWSALYESTLINPAGWSFGKTVLPKRWADNDAGKALNVKTVLGTEFVTCAPTSAIALTGDEKIYVDTLVKFTAFDEEAQFGDATAKLAVWIREMYDTDGETIVGTNLYVTAGKIIDKDVNITSENYLVGEYKGGDWCRLTIKSLGSVKGDGTGVYGFVVYIDGKPVSCTTDKGFGYVTLSDLAAYYNANNILFPSLVKGTEISSLAISGQGAIDDIAFTTEAPDFAVDMLKATITLDGVTAAQLGTITVSANGEVVSGINLSSGSASIYYKKTSGVPTIKVEWTGAGDVLAGEKSTTAGETTLTIGTTDLTHANVYIGSKGYETIANALEDAQANDTITLSNNVEEAVTITKAVTLDLNGKVLTGDIAANANVTIANSDVSRTGKIFNGQIVGTVTMSEGIKLTVRGGYLNGDVEADESEAFAGQFNAEPGKRGGVTLAEGVSPVKISDDPAIWEVGAFVAQIGDAKYLTLAEAVAAAVNGDVIEICKNLEVTGAPIVIDGKILTISNDFAVTFNVTGNYPIQITNATAGVTFTGTGSFAKDSRTDSMVVVWTDGAKLTVDGSLTFTVGAASNILNAKGGEIVVNAGTFSNTTTASNRCVRAELTGKVTINGGSYSVTNVGEDVNSLPVTTKTVNGVETGTVVIPGLVNGQPNTATFNKDETKFCAKGYQTVSNGQEPATWSIAAINYAITASVTGAGGTVSVNKNTYTISAEAQTVTATAVPDSGKAVDGWTLTAPAGVTKVDGANSTVITIPANVTGEVAIAVSFKSGAIQPVDPSTDNPVKYGTEQEATDAAEAINAKPADYIKAPAAFTGDAAAKEAYAGRFEAVIGEDKLTVTIQLKAAEKTALEAQAEVATTNKIGAALQTIAAATGSIDQTITVTPGFYYSVVAGDAIGGMAVRQCALAQGTELTLTIPHYENAGFYKIEATVKPQEEIAYEK